MAKTSGSSRIGWVAGDIELRRYHRAMVEGVFTSTPVPGEVVDTSEGGLGIRTRKPLRVGDSNAFHVQKGSVRVRYEGQVRWCHFEASEKHASGDVVPIYRSGIALHWAGTE